MLAVLETGVKDRQIDVVRELLIGVRGRSAMVEG